MEREKNVIFSYILHVNSSPFFFFITFVLHHVLLNNNRHWLSAAAVSFTLLCTVYINKTYIYKCIKTNNMKSKDRANVNQRRLSVNLSAMNAKRQEEKMPVGLAILFLFIFVGCFFFYFNA